MHWAKARWDIGTCCPAINGGQHKDGLQTPLRRGGSTLLPRQEDPEGLGQDGQA